MSVIVGALSGDCVKDGGRAASGRSRQMACGALAAYNAAMKTALVLRAVRLRFAWLLAIGACVAWSPQILWAQTGAATARTPGGVKLEPAPADSGGAGNTSTTSSDRSIERIRTEDAGSRIDELRVGGETQQITVQPKLPVPSYEVRPAGSARGNPPASGNSDTNGSRVWNLFKF
jgi:hypothetical protein